MPRIKKNITTNTYNRILCFTTSYRRPYMLYNCIRNILTQSFADFTYYVNINIDHPNEQGGYTQLLDEFKADKRLHIIYTQNNSQHQNYLKPIIAAGRDKYNLYIKIDDDDIYKSNYIEYMISHYKKHKKDILSCILSTNINGPQIRLEQLESIGVWQPDVDSPIKFGMPCTYVMNQSAINILLNMTDTEIAAIHHFEDPAWRTKWREAKLTSYVIKKCDNIVYNIHGNNCSSSYLYQDKNQPSENYKYIENDYFILSIIQHQWWQSYVYFNKRNHRIYNIQNDDHGAFTLENNQLKITWDNWGQEEFIKIQDNTSTYFKMI